MTESVETESMQGKGSGASPAPDRIPANGSEILTIAAGQYESRLHRSGKPPTVHVWIDEASDIDRHVFEMLANKRTAEQAIRDQVKRNMDNEA